MKLTPRMFNTSHRSILSDYLEITSSLTVPIGCSWMFSPTSESLGLYSCVLNWGHFDSVVFILFQPSLKVDVTFNLFLNAVDFKYLNSLGFNIQKKTYFGFVVFWFWLF